MDIKGVIKRKGYTIERLAKEMDIHRVTLSQTLNGNPTIKTLKKVADVIGCRVGDFFADELDTPVSTSPNFPCPHCGKPISVKLEQGD